MRKLAIVICFSLSSISVGAQKISLDTLLSFISKNTGSIENYLQASGFHFDNRLDGDISDSHYYKLWHYNQDSVEYPVRLEVNKKSHLLDGIDYTFYSKNEYLAQLNILPNKGFKKKGSTSETLTGISEEFMKDELHIIMTTYFRKNNSYQMTICFCTIVRI